MSLQLFYITWYLFIKTQFSEYNDINWKITYEKIRNILNSLVDLVTLKRNTTRVTIMCIVIWGDGDRSELIEAVKGGRGKGENQR